MISKVTASNKELIKNRIKEINSALEAAGSSTVLDESLESYYANIVEISRLSTDFHGAPYKYLLMPLDEPLFEIDANKRVISVPANFKKNGVGVYGDHMSEVLYFSIDRYFDYQDLFNVDEIIINWQFNASGSSKKSAANSEVHTSIALAPDDTFIPGKVVFGWVITKEMTPSKGSLTFSVSFLKRTGDQYEYVLNTQPASVNINDSLVLENPSVLDSMSRPIFARLMDSSYTPENMMPLADPTFRSGIVKDERGNIIAYKGLPSIANFKMNENGIEEQDLLLQAIGFSSDDGNVKYLWSGTTFADELQGFDPEVIERPMDSATIPEDYVRTISTEPEDNVVYFIKVGQEMHQLPSDEYETVQEAFEDPDLFDEDGKPQIYELGSSFVYSSIDENEQLVKNQITRPGVYSVTIQSEKEVPGSDGVKAKSGNVPSQSCTIPMAAVPTIQLSVEGVSPEDGHYSIVNAEAAAGLTFIDNNTPVITAVIGKDNSKIGEIEGVSEASKLGAVGIYFSENNNAPGLEEIHDLERAEYNTFRPINENGGELSVNTTGMNTESTFKAYAINRRNHNYQISAPSGELKISKIAPFLTAIDVVGIYGAEEINLINDNKVVEGNSIHMTIADGYDCDIKVSCEAVDSGVEVDMKIIEVEVDAGNNIVNYLEGSDKDIPNVYDQYVIEDGKFIFSLNEDSGHFVVRAFTTYNGTQRVSETEPFSITWDR